MIQNEIRSGHLARPHLVPPPSQNVHRDPGVKHQPYLYINDPLNDSSGDQGNFLKDYIYSIYNIINTKKISYFFVYSIGIESDFSRNEMIKNS